MPATPTNKTKEFLSFQVFVLLLKNTEFAGQHKLILQHLQNIPYFVFLRRFR